MTDKRAYKNITVSLLLLLSFIWSGCAQKTQDNLPSGRSQTSPPVRTIRANFVQNSPTIFTLAMDLASQLRANLRKGLLKDWPLIVTTLVNIDNLNSSTRFGRTLSEALSEEMFKKGGIIKEVRSAKAVYLKPQTGEMMLSRDVKLLAKNLDARAVIVGTYSIGARSVVVNVKMVDIRSQDIISVATMEIARSTTIDALLGESMHKKMEAVPTAYDENIL